MHLDETTAVQPLERTSEWEAGELPETFPSGSLVEYGEFPPEHRVEMGPLSEPEVTV